MTKSEKPILAYIVQTEDPEDSVVSFATTNIAARRMGANEIGAEFEDVTCRRLKWADEYAGSKIPVFAFIKNGWRYACWTCGVSVSDETKDPVLDQSLVFCSEACCATEKKEKLEAESRKQEVIDAIQMKYPGVEVTYASDRADDRYVRFKFPGGMNSVRWRLSDDFVEISQIDIQAWNRWRKESHETVDA